MDIDGWKVTATGWVAQGDQWRRGFILTRSGERHAGSYEGEQDEAAFETFVRKAANEKENAK